MQKIDAKGLDCPRPVIMAKNVIDKENVNELIIEVDNEIATQNLTKLGENLGFYVKVIKEDEKLYKVLMNKSENKVFKEADDIRNNDMASNPKSLDNSDYIVVFSSNKMGQGKEEFSTKLLNNFVFALKEQDKKPKFILLYNLGVELTTINENTVEDLLELENQGVEILSCGLCLEEYDVKDKLKVGSVTNMYRICEIMRTFKVVNPC